MEDVFKTLLIKGLLLAFAFQVGFIVHVCAYYLKASLNVSNFLAGGQV